MDNQYIYLDNSATTALCDEAKKAMTAAMEEYGNPSSVHVAGVQARKRLEQARDQIASALGIRDMKPGQLVLTSCGSEATNLALFGSVRAKARRTASRILTTDSEHPSVENVMKQLEQEGLEVIRIPTRRGVLDMDAVDEALKQPVLLVSMMMVNNETGARYDVETVFRKTRSRWPEAVLHCDAVQGFQKCRFTVNSLGADLVTVSSHKIHGPKGVGALYISQDMLKKKKIVPVLLGGGQENGFRSGTENMLGIVGFGAACEAGAGKLTEDLQKMESLRELAIQLFGSDTVRLNIPQGPHAPHILNITLPGIKSETMLHYLSSRGICVSAGSACSSHARHPSRSLMAFGLTAEEADTSLRISFSRYNTEEDVKALADGVREGIRSLVRIQR